MKNKYWSLTNLSLQNDTPTFDGGGFQFFTENSGSSESEQIYVHVDGYFLFREDCQQDIELEDQESAVKILYTKYGKEFVKKIKGIFTIVILFRERFEIYTDHLGLSKFFYVEREGKFIISNSFEKCVQNSSGEISPTNIALFSLMYHFYDGITLFKDVFHALPASAISYNGKKLEFSKYWTLNELRESKKEKSSLTLNEVHEKNLEVLKGYLDRFKGLKTSLTLTAGFDSRYILSGLLKLGAKPNTISYGNDAAKDVEIAGKISKGVGLTHSNYFLPYNLETYTEYANRSIKSGEGLTHLHRAHRLYMSSNADLSGSVLFTGHNGGESIRGITYNDYFDSGLLKDINAGIEITEEYLRTKLKKYFIRDDKIDHAELIHKIKNYPFYSGNAQDNIFQFLYTNVASLHHYQDLFLYGLNSAHVVPFFLDIDILTNLFRSDFNLFELNSVIKKQKFPKFYSTGIVENYPVLGKFIMNRNYSPTEYLKFGSLIYLIKKIRDRKEKKSVPNYSYGDWYPKFYKNELDFKSSLFSEVYDLERVQNELATQSHKTTEGYWLKFSNIVYFQKIYSSLRG